MTPPGGTNFAAAMPKRCTKMLRFSIACAPTNLKISWAASNQESVLVLEEYREKLMAGSVTQSPEKVLMRRQIAKLLETAIARLPDTFGPVFVLREIEGLSVEDTAEALQIPEETVKTRLFRARRRLQKELDPELCGALSETFPFAGADCEALTNWVITRFCGSAKSI
jgi:RNA polymerase sigma-70 factor, ECF subfamily